MASGSHGSGSSGTTKDYDSDLINQFSNADRTVRTNVVSRETQTEICARLASKRYGDINNVSLTVKEAAVGDSICFEGKYISQGDNNYYYHAMFKATIGNNKTPILFFAELKGGKRPEEVLQCVILETEENVDKCQFCSSIYHPPGDYLGKIN